MKTIFRTALTAVESTDIEGVGTLRFENSKVYKWVRLQNTTATVAGAAGDAVAYDNEDGHLNSHVVVDCSDASTIPVGAGMLLATVTGTAGTAYYCWIQIKGHIVASTTLGGSAGDGHCLYKSTTDKELAKAAEADSTAVYKQVVGYTPDASAKYVICDFPF